MRRVLAWHTVAWITHHPTPIEWPGCACNASFTSAVCLCLQPCRRRAGHTLAAELAQLHSLRSSQANAHAQVVGEKEKAERLVNVRTRDNKVHGMHALQDVIPQLCRERDARHLASTFGEQVGAQHVLHPVEESVRRWLHRG